ncbi:nuclear transport factor 2 family protein [Terriglobus saanensis]|uniref:SnoaL-like domain-containing protein n=1 Tax=Terriglobus saanensis (strain ATCC BAA-1853 / DSM 23119 / SP1PR4) TaxID=401053 RepID=E8UY45_TERSS|nr:nuclear transport factor 2 family protein [Terriglobus saanensis]ADV80855.1 hypothetical protein AciPR4_0013 [Terriglobus saanensis SP1PR4]
MSLKIEEQIGALAAKTEICEVLTRYIRAVDRVDEQSLSATFHTGAAIAQGGYVMPAEQFIPIVVGLLRELESTHHQLSPPLIELRGDTAFVESYFTGFHRLGPNGWSPFPDAKPSEDIFIGGRYIDRFERRDGLWAITDRQSPRDWIRYETAADRGGMADPPNPRSFRSKHDPAYQR